MDTVVTLAADCKDTPDLHGSDHGGVNQSSIQLYQIILSRGHLQNITSHIVSPPPLATNTHSHFLRLTNVGHQNILEVKQNSPNASQMSECVA